MNYLEHIKCYQDFPKKDIIFWDFTYLLKDVKVREKAMDEIQKSILDQNIDKIIAIESKGFIIGAILADRLKKSLILIRKPNLIPGEYYTETFEKEYGQGEYQIKKDAIKKGEKVAIIYDIMAGSGATNASINLIERCGGVVKKLIYITELEYLKGRQEIKCKNIFSLIKIKEKK